MINMSIFSSKKRQETIEHLTNTNLDVLVIGGGITGAGIALDATQRGLQTGLVEMQDYAAGTSSRSTKLVHGGLRYLKQFEVKLVAEVGKERAIVYENGPHVTTPEWMMLPFYKGGTFGPLSTSIGLRTYDFLAGVKKSERRKMFSVDKALETEPLLQSKGLKGAGYYVEYKTDDARLTIEVMKKAVELGASAINYSKVKELVYDEAGKVNGAQIEDQITGETYTINAKKVINAAGPWVDEIRDMDGSKRGKTLFLTKGVHLVFDKEKFPLRQAIYFDVADKRMIFAIPRDGKTYVGTTDTSYDADTAHPAVTKADCDYLLKAINDMFPNLDLSEEDVESSWAGVRPLIGEEGKDPSEISRKDEIFVSDSGLYSMAGGKLTGYRKMAVDVVDAVVAEFKKEGTLFSASGTMHLPISGGLVGGSKGFAAFKQQRRDKGTALGLDEKTADALIQTYGSNVDTVFDLFVSSKEQAEKEGIDPVVFATILYAIDYEAVYKPVDFFVRRTGALFFDIHWVHTHKESVIRYMEKTLHWSKEQTSEYTTELEQLLTEAVSFD